MKKTIITIGKRVSTFISIKVLKFRTKELCYAATLILCLSNGAMAQVCFTPASGSPYGAGSGPYAVCTADFNGDYYSDWAAANSGSLNVSVRLGGAGGTFGANTNYALAASTCEPLSVCSADFNGDGKPDLATANYYTNNISVLMGNGAGSFGAYTNYNTGTTGPQSICAYSWSSGAYPDIAVANNGNNTISIFKNTGTGFGTFTLSPTAIAVVGTNPECVVSGDFNGDTYTDLATANYGSNNVSIIMGTSAHGFSGSTNTFTVGTNPQSISVGDFNGDTYLDLAVANTGSSNVSILLNNGLGIFTTAGTTVVGSGPYSICTADFNNDGKLDLATANSTGYGVSVLVGNGTGNFGAAINFALSGSTSPEGISAGDFNGDTYLDLAVADGGSNYVYILLNSLPGPVSITPTTTTICTGSTTTLTASGAGNYMWSPNNDNTNTAVLSPTVTTTYTVTGRNTGCSATSMATITINVNALPTVMVNSGAICTGNSFTMSPSGASTYTYSSGSAVVTPTTNATYTVTGTDVNSCTNTAVSTVTVNPLPTVTITPTSTAVCVGSSDILTAGGASTYTWSNNAGSATTSTVSVSPTTTQNYGVTGTDANGCVNNAAIPITVNPLPTVTVNSPAICTGATATLTASGASIYNWSTGAPVVSPMVTTDYTVTGTDVNNCINTATSTVTVNPLPTVSVNSATVCAGHTATLTASGATSYLWNTGATTANTIVTPAVTTTYTVTGTDANNTCTNTATGTVTMLSVATPAICMVTTDSVTNYQYNVIYWDKIGLTHVDSFLVYRKDNSTGNYLHIGSVSKDSLSQFTDTAFSIGGPNGGNPQIAAWRYKLAVKDSCGNIGAKSPYHQSIFVTESGSNFNFSAYIDSGNVSLPTGYGLFRDNNNTGNFQLVANIGSSPATDPNYSSYPNANWRIDALGFNCTPTLRLAGNNSTYAAKIKAHSNINNNRMTGINKLANTNAVNIYPNPAKEMLNVELGIINGTNTLQITDMLGSIHSTFIIQNSPFQISVADLSEGVYNISISSNEGVVNKRLVIVR